MFEKYGPNEKNDIHEIIYLPFNFTMVWENVVEIGSFVTEIQNFGKNVCSILYDINLFERYGQYEKMFISKTILVFYFTSVYQIYLIGPLIEKLKMFDTNFPILMAPKCLRGEFLRGAKLFPNKHAETNLCQI